VQHDFGAVTPGGITRRGPRNGVTGEVEPLIVPAPEALLAAARQAVQGLTLPPIELADGKKTPRIVEGVIVTGDVFMSDAARRDEIRSSVNGSAVEMEGAAMVQACRQFAVACLVVRSITDRADGEATANYKQFIAAASENAATLVTAIIARLP
jgi:adenosylhomocysteine nucleosidase